MVTKCEGKRQPGRPRNRTEGNITMDLKEVGCEDMEWVQLAQNAIKWHNFVNMVTNFQVL